MDVTAAGTVRGDDRDYDCGSERVLGENVVCQV